MGRKSLVLVLLVAVLPALFSLSALSWGQEAQPGLDIDGVTVYRGYDASGDQPVAAVVERRASGLQRHCLRRSAVVRERPEPRIHIREIAARECAVDVGASQGTDAPSPAAATQRLMYSSPPMCFGST